MTDPTPSPEVILKKLSRRTLLRNTAMTATGAVLLPAFLTGCHKDVWDVVKGHVPAGAPGGGLGAVQLTPDELTAAADNLNRMRALLNDLYDHAFKYDVDVFVALGSTNNHPSWTNFIVNAILDIAAAMAAAVAIVLEGPLAVPAIACLSAFLHDWGIGKNAPPDFSDLNSYFANYQFGQQRMQDAIDAHLGFLTDVTNNYANLQAAWQNPIVFNDKTYTLADLAHSFFPDKEHHDVEYRKIYDPMYLHHQKSVWNLAIMKCCRLYWHYPYVLASPFLNYNRQPYRSAVEYAQKEFYAKTGSGGEYPSGYPGSYMRLNLYNDFYHLYIWDLGIDGYAFPDAASDILFMDDTPGHIINPKGLFNRSYVFQQFHTTKPDFSGGHELASTPDRDFADSDEFNFTGGLFPKLTH